MKNQKTVVDTYTQITNTIIELMESGIIPWKKSWRSTLETAKNFTSGNNYNGINRIVLNITTAMKGYTTNNWITFKQAGDINGRIKKGERGIKIVYWCLYKENEQVPQEAKNEDEKVGMYPKIHTVFNLDQTEGIEIPKQEQLALNENEKDCICEQIVAGMPDSPVITTKGHQPCYTPVIDEIYMPGLETFDSTEEYYSTLFHELGHSTGHAKRLNRKELMTLTSKHSYSKEELVAEFTSAFLCEEANILPKTIENSAAYLQSWINVLKNDKKMLLLGASQAQKAANYILARK